MHEIHHPELCLVGPPRRLRHDHDGPDWRDLALVVLLVVAVLLVFLVGGCAADAPAVADLGRHTAAALTVAKPGSYAAGAAVALANAEAGADWISGLGMLCFAAGGLCIGHPQGPSGLGFGLIVAGALCVVAAAVLPLLAGWLGLVALAIVIAVPLAQKAGLFARIQKTLTDFSVTNKNNPSA